LPLSSAPVHPLDPPPRLATPRRLPPMLRARGRESTDSEDWLEGMKSLLMLDVSVSSWPPPTGPPPRSTRVPAVCEEDLALSRSTNPSTSSCPFSSSPSSSPSSCSFSLSCSLSASSSSSRNDHPEEGEAITPWLTPPRFEPLRAFPRPAPAAAAPAAPTPLPSSSSQSSSRAAAAAAAAAADPADSARQCPCCSSSSCCCSSASARSRKSRLTSLPQLEASRPPHIANTTARLAPAVGWSVTPTNSGGIRHTYREARRDPAPPPSASSPAFAGFPPSLPP
ncbi:unnamed protein product, partial [Ectocarpus fasciculatus]